MDISLAIMAAGLGSRYKGLKQLDQLGPNGEVLMDYSIKDAVDAGFTKIILIIREEFAKECKERMDLRWASKVRVEYVYQCLNDLPDGFSLNPERSKPWGTGQALLCLKDAVSGPFALINADDYYGQDSYKKAYHFLSSTGGQNATALVGYTLDETLSPNGSVSRGVCEVSTDKSKLLKISERTKINSKNNKVYWTDKENNQHELDAKSIASMNFWVFTPSIFKIMERKFEEFLNLNQNKLTEEFFIPVAVNEAVKEKQIEVTVLRTDASWFGVTYPEDKKLVQEKLKER